jgi:glutamate formiminotransferase
MPGTDAPVECVINVSEGRSRSVVDALRTAAGATVLDVHSDPQHNRSVLTLGGALDAVQEAARSVVTVAVDRIDLRTHYGIHPRFGAADVVPFVSLDRTGSAGATWRRVIGARDSFAEWAGTRLALPCFLYGPERSLPDVRRTAFTSLLPEFGPHVAHPTAGATAVGARPVLVAYNVWISGPPDREPLAVARAIAGALRSPTVRTLGLPVDAGAQVSCNLLDPVSTPMTAVYDAVVTRAVASGCSVDRAELVGLLPEAALRAVPARRWTELDIGEERTIEFRLEAAARLLAGQLPP